MESVSLSKSEPAIAIMFLFAFQNFNFVSSKRLNLAAGLLMLAFFIPDLFPYILNIFLSFEIAYLRILIENLV